MLAAIETKENEPIPVFRGRERCKAEKKTYPTRSTMLVIISDISLRFCKVFSLLLQTVNVTGQRRSRASLLPLAEISCIPQTSRLPMRLSTCLFTTMKLCESSPLFFRHLTLFPHLIPTCQDHPTERLVSCPLPQFSHPLSILEPSFKS